MIDGVLPFQDDLGNGDESIAFLQQMLDNTRQCFRRMLRGIVEQDDAAGLDFARHPFRNIRRRQVFPVQAVTTGNGCKSLGHLYS